MRTGWIAYLSLLVIVACASLDTGSRNTPKAVKPLSIIFTSNRFGALETCDCVLNKLGGVNREWNLTNRWFTSSVGTILSFTGGTSFLPAPKEFSPRSSDLYFTRASFLVDALNRLNLSALSPSANDLSLGIEPLRGLAKRAKFPFVTTNLVDAQTGKPLFAPFVEIEHDGLKILVLGVSAARDPKYPENAAVKRLDAIEALGPVLDGKTPDTNLIVLLSSLGEKEREAVQARFPQIHIILGAHPDAPVTFNIRQHTGDTLYLNPSGEGRSVALIELEMRKPIKNFYNPWLAATTKDVRQVWEQRIAEVESRLAETTKADARVELLDRRKELETYLEKSGSIPLELSPDTIPYRATTVELDDSYAFPDNELGVLLKEYRQAVRAFFPQKKSRKPTEQEEEPEDPTGVTGTTEVQN